MMTLSLNQGVDAQDRTFGYVAGDGGGYFFTWNTSLDATLDSIDVDSESGNGGLMVDQVREFLADKLPKTSMGRRLWSAQ